MLGIVRGMEGKIFDTCVCRTALLSDFTTYLEHFAMGISQ